MNAALASTDRWGNWRQAKAEAIRTGQYQPRTGERRHDASFERTDREAVRTEHAAATGTSRGAWL